MYRGQGGMAIPWVARGDLSSPRIKDPAGAFEWAFNSRTQRYRKRIGEVIAAFFLCLTINSRHLPSHATAFRRQTSARGSAVRFSPGGGEWVLCLAASFKIWSFEPQSYTKDKTQENCGTTVCGRTRHRRVVGKDLTEAWDTGREMVCLPVRAV